MTKWVAYYSILMGILQAGTWGLLAINGTVAGYYTDKPIETTFLILAELLTAGAVILGGSSVLAGWKWGVPLNLAALGMMQYCVIFSCGVFGQSGNVPAAAWFAVLSLATFAAIVMLLAPSLRRQAA